MRFRTAGKTSSSGTMRQIIEHLVFEHDYRMVGLAIAACMLGASMTVLLCRRMLAANPPQRHIQLALTGFIAGATIWTTNFVSMLAFDPGSPHGYDLYGTLLSLTIAIIGCALSFGLLSRRAIRFNAFLAGGCFGLTNTLIHYVGMSALIYAGTIHWNTGYILTALLVGSGLGAAAFRQCRDGTKPRHIPVAATYFVVAICAVHFIGMAAIELAPDPHAGAPEQTVNGGFLGLIVMAVMMVILLVGFASLMIEMQVHMETRAQVRNATLRDTVTGLPNRLQLREHFDALHANYALAPPDLAVLAIDLDRFKEINTIYGHAVGDQVLTIVAERLRWAADDMAFVARTGGNEFAALLHPCSGEGQAQDFAQELLYAISAPIDLGITPITISAAIGFAVSTDEHDPLDMLMGHADLAMYRAKSGHSSAICAYNPDMDREAEDKIQLIRDLQNAVDSDQFELVFQLQNEVISLDPVGFEVLLRWNHPTLGRIPPTTFIPIAEETGLIKQIGLWVLRHACAEAVTWDSDMSIAVNVAPQQLAQSDFVGQVLMILHETDFPAHRLELEVTEVSIIKDSTSTLKTMHALKDMGVRFAMDDFGTGYSSLSTLQSFPFDKIKLDRSFIAGLHAHHERAVIVRSTLWLGTALQIPVLAEGVEEEEELAFLREENCAYVQGYYFGKPKTVEEVRVFLATRPLANAS